MLVENNVTASSATTVYITLTNGNNGSSMMLSTPKNGIMKRAMPNGAGNRDDLTVDPAKVSNKPVQKFMVSISATNSPTIGRRNLPLPTMTAAVPPPSAAVNQRAGQKNDQQTRNLLFEDQLRQKIDQLTLNDLKLNLKNIFPDNKCHSDIDNLTPQKAHSTPDLMQRIDETCGAATTAADEKKHRSKRVMFADDRGFQLVTIRILSEPRDFPPNFRYQEVVDLLGCGFYSNRRTAATSAPPASTTNAGDDEVFTAASAAPKPTSSWQCKFKQPASDYMAFRQKLDQNKVALENVMIKNDESSTNNNNNNNDNNSDSSSSSKMTGTIKVKNMSFEKSVVLRLSTDQWSTFVDHQCKYKPYRKAQQNGAGAAPTVRCPDVYDTFDFEIDLKNDDNTRCSCVQFCIKYSSNGVDYWDSNNGANFQVENVAASTAAAAAKGAAADTPPPLLPPGPPHPPSAATAADSPLLSGLNREAPASPTTTRTTTAPLFRPGAAAQAQAARSRPKNFPIFQASPNFCPILEQQQNDAFCLQMNNWTQFASWSHLSSDAPYW